MFGAKLSWCQIVRCQIVLVPNCPGAKLSVFIILVPNCPMPNCPVPNCPTIHYNNITTLSLEKGIFVGISGADRVDDDVAPQRDGADVGDSEQIRSHPTRLPACLCLAACWRASWMVKGDRKISPSRWSWLGEEEEEAKVTPAKWAMHSQRNPKDVLVSF